MQERASVRSNIGGLNISSGSTRKSSSEPSSFLTSKAQAQSPVTREEYSTYAEEPNGAWSIIRDRIAPAVLTAAQEEQNRLLDIDLSTLKAEIDRIHELDRDASAAELRQQNIDISSPNHKEVLAETNAIIKAYKEAASGLPELEQEYAKAKELQDYYSGTERFKAYDNLENADELVEESVNTKTSVIQEENDRWSNFSLHDYINDTKGIQARLQAIESSDPYYIYSLMTEEEKRRYNIIFAAEGEDVANEYLDFIKDELTYRAGIEEGEYYVENPVARVLVSPLLGVQNWARGIAQTFTDEALPMSIEDYATQYFHQNAEEGWRIASSIGENIGQMAPTVVAGTFGGNIAGAGAMFFSSKGNAYREALQQGYTKDQAQNYSILIGASEALLQNLLGGISSVGGKLTRNLGNRMIQNINSAALRTAARLGKSALAEGTEEYLQAILEPMFRNLALDENNEFQIFTEEAAESFLYGAVLGAMFEGAPLILDTQNSAEIGSRLKADMGNNLNAFIESALQLDNRTTAYQLAQNLMAGRWEKTDTNIGEFYKAYFEETGGRFNYTASTFTKPQSRYFGEVSSLDELNRKYRELALQYHPDRLDLEPGSPEFRQASDRFAQINADKVALEKWLNEGIRVRDVYQSSGETAEEPAPQSVDTIESAYIQKKGGTQATNANAEVETSETGPASSPEENILYDVSPVNNGGVATGDISLEEYSRALQNARLARAAEQAAPEPASIGTENGQISTLSAINPQPSTNPGEVTERAESAVATHETAGNTVRRAGNVGNRAVSRSIAETTGAAPAVLESASGKYGAQAQAFLHTYTPGQDAAKYDAAYERVYNYGKSGELTLEAVRKLDSVAYLSGQQIELAYETGKAAANSSRSQTKAGGNTGRKAGVVRGDGVTTGDLRAALNDQQGRAYRILSTVAEATGIDIVLYRSEADAEGRYREAQGRYDRSEPGTIYIDINAGLSSVKDVNDLGKYAMLRTFSHEFVHFIENWNPEQYNEFREAVFDKLREQGENVEDFLDAKRALGLTEEAARREVVAEAMTDILPDTKFVEELAEKHKNIFQRLWEKLKEFAANIRAYYRKLGKNRSREANALKEQVGETVRYFEEIVKAFDEVAVQAVENYQAAVADIQLNKLAPVYETLETRKEIEPIDFEERNRRMGKAAEEYGLTKEENWLVDRYVKDFAYFINRKILQGTLKKGEEQYISDIIKAFKKFPEYRGRTYRNVRFDLPWQPESAYGDFLSEYADGNTVLLRAFTSTSKIPNGYPVFGDKVVHLVIDGVSGRDIADTYGIPRQQEVVLLPGTAIKITQVTTANDGNVLIYAQEVLASDSGRDYENQGSPQGNDSNYDIRGNRIDGTNETGGQVRGNTRNIDRRDGLLSERRESNNPGDSLGDGRRGEIAQGNTQHQAREYLEDAKTFAKEIDTWDKEERPAGEIFVLGSTGEVLQGLGAIESDIYMLGDKIETILSEHKEMTLNEIKRIPEILNNPALILKSRNVGRTGRTNSRLVIFGTVKAQNGQPVLTVLDLRPSEGRLIIDDMQKVTSAYTKDNNPVAFVLNSDVLYADKQRTNRLLRWIGFQTPTELLRHGSLGSIFYENNNVNMQGIPFSDIVTEEGVPKQNRIQYQARTSPLTDREVLSMAAEGIEVEGLTEAEEDALGIFRNRLEKLNRLTEQRMEQGRRYREEQFGEGGDRAAARQTRNRMQELDRQIERAQREVLKVEEAEVLRRVLKQGRKVIEAQERARGQEMLRRYRDRRDNAAAIRKYRQRIEQKSRKLSGMLLKNTEKQHIPEALKEAVGGLLENLDFTSRRQLGGGAATQADARYMQRLERLRNVLQRQSEYMNNPENATGMEGYLDLPGGFVEEISEHMEAAQKAAQAVSGVSRINAMTSEELERLDHILTVLDKSISQINKLVANGRYQTVYEAAEETIKHLARFGSHSGRYEKTADFLQWKNTTPYYAFKRFGQAGVSIFEGLQDGWDKLAFNVQAVVDFAGKTYTGKEVKAWGNEVQNVKLTSGETARMTTAQLMSAYCLARREQARGHLLGGGMRVDNITVKKDTIHQEEPFLLTAQDLETIEGRLTARQKKVADELQKYMSTVGASWGNEISMKRFGYRAFAEENYFPIASDRTNMPAVDPGARENDLFRLLNLSMTKSLTYKANNAVVISDIFDVFANHMADMAKYNALALPILDAMKWYNYRDTIRLENGQHRTSTVQRAMEKAYGKRAQNYFITFMKDLNGTREGGREDGWWNRMVGNYKVAAVGANLRVALLQPTSYVRAVAVLNPRFMAKALTMKPAVKEMLQYSGIAVWKELGFYDTNIGRNVRSLIKGDATVREAIVEKSMKAAELGDRVTWGALWNACKLEQRTKGVAPEQLMEATARRFREVVYATQVVDSTMTRSHTMRSSSPVAKTLTAFMSEPTLSYNMLLDAYQEYQTRKKLGKAWGTAGVKITRALFAYGISALAAAVAESVMDALRDDDDYETFSQKWLQAFLGEEGSEGNLVADLNPLNKLPILKDVMNELTGYGNNRMDTQWITSIADAWQAWNSDGNTTLYGKIYKTLQAVSRFGGIPVSNFAREVAAVYNNTLGIITGEKLKTYDAGEKNAVKNSYQSGNITEEEALSILVDKNLVENEDEAYWLVQEWSSEGGSYSRYDRLYDAVKNGGDVNAAMEELLEHGYTEKDIIKQLKGKIGEWYRGTDSAASSITRQQAIGMLENYCDMDAGEVDELVTKWSAEVETGISYDDIKQAYLEGEVTASEAAEMRVKYGGEDVEDAEATVLKWQAEKETGVAYEEIAETYLEGGITAAEAVEMWQKYGGLSWEDANEKITVAEFNQEYPELDWEASTIVRYRSEVEPYGIDAGVYDEYMVNKKECKGTDLDGDGKTDSGSVKREVLLVIDALPLTNAQKDQLYQLNGWSQRTIYEAPWH